MRLRLRFNNKLKVYQHKRVNHAKLVYNSDSVLNLNYKTERFHSQNSRHNSVKLARILVRFLDPKQLFWQPSYT